MGDTQAMKGRYNGCIMNIRSEITGYGRLADIPVLSKKARQRPKWFDYCKSYNQNARLTCRYFGISPNFLPLEKRGCQ
jgi:hypothetical protein